MDLGRFMNNTKSVDPGPDGNFYLARIQLQVGLSVCLLVLPMLLGSVRRRCDHKALQTMVWGAYTGSFMIACNTIGQMQSAPFATEFFAMWAVLLVFVFGGSHSITAYSIEDIEQRNMRSWSFTLQTFFIVSLIGSSCPAGEITMLYYTLLLFFMYKTREVFAANESASISYGMVRNTKLVADFMSYEHDLSNQDEVDPAQMQGYNYLVRGEEDLEIKAKPSPPLYKKKLEITDEVITVDKVWRCEGRLLSNVGDPDGKLKDICLSFALFKMLKRRFVGYPFVESQLPKTWNFVSQGLLSDDHHERAFRVVEVELAFLYDFFYTKYPIIFTEEHRIRKLIMFGRIKKVVLFVLLIVFSFVGVQILMKHKIPYVDLDYTNTVIDAGVRLTGSMILIIIALEIWQFTHLVFSDWTKVWLVCKYVKKSPILMNLCVVKVISYICRRRILNPWKRKLTQYFLLKSIDENRLKSIIEYLFTTSSVELSGDVKKAVLLLIKTTGSRFANGVISLGRNQVGDLLSWACRLETNTHSILVWHIATTLCFDSPIEPDFSNQSELERFRNISTTISGYCAYLVASVPALLPDHAYETEIIFEQAVSEAKDTLKGCKSMRSKFEMMMNVTEGETIIERGAKLGKQLLQDIKDQETRWKVLADFWVEMMLFIAPSDNATAHAKSLTNGGEFITHLWALLSHAGILSRNSPIHEDA